MCVLNAILNVTFPAFCCLYASSSTLNIAFLIWLLLGTNFNPLDNNEISTLVSFHSHKLTTLLLTNLTLIHLFKVNISFPSSFKWFSEWSQPVKLYLFKTSSPWKPIMSNTISMSELLSTKVPFMLSFKWTR